MFVYEADEKTRAMHIVFTLHTRLPVAPKLRSNFGAHLCASNTQDFYWDEALSTPPLEYAIV